MVKLDLSHVKFTPSFKIVSLYNEWHIGLALSLDSEDEDVALSIKRELNKIRRYSLNPEYHVTLAYRFREFEASDRLQVTDEIERLRALICGSIPLTFNADETKIYKFNDMTKFSEW